MKIATFNPRDLFDEGPFLDLFHKEFILTREFVQKRVDYLAGTIRNMDPDLLFMQEVASESVLRRVAKQAGSEYSVFIAKPNDRGISNAALYKSRNFSCSSIPSLGALPVFADGDEDLYGKRLDSGKVRDFVQVEAEYQGRSLHVFGVHLKSGIGIGQRDASGKYLNISTQLEAADGLIRARMFQFSQARRLREIIDAIFAKEQKAQIVVLGDFNSLDKGDSFHIIEGELKEGAETLINACEDIPEGRRFSHIRHGRKSLIDHILVSASIRKKIQSVVILNDKLIDQFAEKEQALIVESDHAPIMVELTES